MHPEGFNKGELINIREKDARDDRKDKDVLEEVTPAKNSC